MRPPRQVFFVELILAISLTFACVFTDSIIVELELSNAYVSLMSNLFELNLAVVIAFMIAILADRKIKYKNMQLKRIASNSILIVAVNSIVMSGYSLCGSFGLAIIVPTLVGNMCRVWGICREILEVV